ncbi:MAG: lipopolysaccharide heptosyltransferase II [Candidatus Aminicenantes bacterium]|nr:lipopolysaccharide heptosyltransferase II [Candidatus Aminicenantes bacterium]
MRILVRMPNWLGDTILALPSLRALINNFPEAEIWVAAPSRSLELFEVESGIAGVVEIPELLTVSAGWRLSRRWREFRFDLTILFPNSFSSAMLAWLAGIPERWGYRSDGRAWLLTKAIAREPKISKLEEEETEKKEDHQAIYYLNLLRQLNLKVPTEPEIKIKITDEEKEMGRQRLLSLGLDPLKMRAQRKPLVVLNPGAAYGPAKRWPTSRFGFLAANLEKALEAVCLIIGSREEENLAKEIIEAAQEKRIGRTPLNLCGKTTLRELTSVLSWANLMITNDSGPMHLANALRVPVVALFGPTDPRKTRPWHEPSFVLHKKVICWPCWYRVCPYDHRCLAAITEAEVLEASLSLLQTSEAKRDESGCLS